MHHTTEAEAARALVGMTETEAARQLVVMYAQRCRLTHVMAGAEQPTGEMAQAVLDAGTRLDTACEAFRSQFHPRRHRVCVGLFSVMAVSRTGRNVRTIYDGWAEFSPSAA